jgi:hypothetical protein
MITKFKELFSKKKKDFELGEYVVIRGIKYDDNKQELDCNNYYGKIIDIGTPSYSSRHKVVLVELTNKLSEEELFKLEMKYKNISSGIKSIYDEIKTFSFHGVKLSGWTKKRPCCWYAEDYIVQFNSKEEYDKEVEEIEFLKNANKYNL